MNFTYGRTLPNIGKRINWHVVMLVGGLALVISIAAANGVFQRHSRPAPATGLTSIAAQPAAVQPAVPGTSSMAGSSSTAAQPALPSKPTETMLPQVIIVSSQEQADRLQEQMAADQMAAFMNGYEAPIPEMSFVVIDSPEKQYLYDAITGDQMGLATFDLIDLRR